MVVLLDFALEAEPFDRRDGFEIFFQWRETALQPSEGFKLGLRRASVCEFKRREGRKDARREKLRHRASPARQ